MKLGPHGVLIRKIESGERKTAGGIIIPGTQKQVKPKAEVVATGKGMEDFPMEAKVGDIVFYPSVAAKEVEVDGKDLLLISMNDILYFER